MGVTRFSPLCKREWEEGAGYTVAPSPLAATHTLRLVRGG